MSDLGRDRAGDRIRNRFREGEAPIEPSMTININLYKSGSHRGSPARMINLQTDHHDLHPT